MRIVLRHPHLRTRASVHSTSSCSSAVLLLLLAIIIVGYIRLVHKLRAQTKQGFRELGCAPFILYVIIRTYIFIAYEHSNCPLRNVAPFSFRDTRQM